MKRAIWKGSILIKLKIRIKIVVTLWLVIYGSTKVFGVLVILFFFWLVIGIRSLCEHLVNILVKCVPIFVLVEKTYLQMIIKSITK